MKALKIAGVWLAVLVFGLSLTVFVFSLTTSQTIGRKQTVEKWLEDSGSYASLAEEITNVDISVSNVHGTKNTLNKPEVLKAAVEASFTKETLKDWSENFLNGTYDWLGGKTDKPEIHIDVLPVKQGFADALAIEFLKEYESRPVCSSGTQTTLLTKDPLGASCKADVFNTTEYIETLKQDVTTSTDFLSKNIYTADDITLDPNGAPIYEQFSALPAAYRLLKIAPIVSFVLALVSAVIIMFFSPSKRQGTKKITSKLFGAAAAGLLSILFMSIGLWLSGGLVNSGSGAGVALRITKPLGEQVVKSMLVWSVGATICLVLLGVTIKLVSKKMYPVVVEKIEQNPSPKA